MFPRSSHPSTHQRGSHSPVFPQSTSARSGMPGPGSSVMAPTSKSVYSVSILYCSLVDLPHELFHCFLVVVDK